MARGCDRRQAACLQDLVGNRVSLRSGGESTACCVRGVLEACHPSGRRIHRDSGTTRAQPHRNALQRGRTSGGGVLGSVQAFLRRL